jgi:hypothetical protein
MTRPFKEAAGADESMDQRFRPSEGMFLYLVGLVVIATNPDRFWLGFSLAILPVVVGAVGRAFAAPAWRPL